MNTNGKYSMISTWGPFVPSLSKGECGVLSALGERKQHNMTPGHLKDDNGKLTA